MTVYRIENTRSGAVLGDYEVRDAAEALEALARNAGYASYAHACEVAPVAEGEILVYEVAGGETVL